VRNTVWITADMHYTAAHYYDPNRAVFQDFEPFWEFISGPLHAGTWGPGELDNTFGPQVMYQNGCSAEQGENLAPLRIAVLRPRGDRRRDGGDDGDAEGRERPQSLGGADRAEAPALDPRADGQAYLGGATFRDAPETVAIGLSQMQPKPRMATRPED